MHMACHVADDGAGHEQVSATATLYKAPPAMHVMSSLHHAGKQFFWPGMTADFTVIMLSSTPSICSVSFSGRHSLIFHMCCCNNAAPHHAVLCWAGLVGCLASQHDVMCMAKL